MPQRRGYQRRPASQRAAGEKPGDVYEQVNGRIMAALESGTAPWRKPWPASVARPLRMSNGEPYKGVNVLLTGMTAMERGYTSPWWGTFKQIQALGGNVRYGENQQNGRGATKITIWRDARPDEEEERPETGENGGDQPERKTRVYASMRGVFNADQCEGLPAKYYPEPGEQLDQIETPETVLAADDASPGAATVCYDVGGRAYYDPAADQIHMPPLSGHTSAERYYSTGYHERVHSTGHKSRLDRDTVGHGHKFGSEGYGREELTAELGTAYLCAATGVDTSEVTEQNAAYLQSWIDTINEDKWAVVRAAHGASAAADRILEPSRQADPAAEPDTEPADAGGIEAA
jgi:antirestriction protein ArdC